MSEYDEICLKVFLEKQLQLFPEKVADTLEEAEDFLDLCMASVCRDINEVQECFDEYGADISGMKKKDLENMAEVFPLPDGRYLVVPA
ncbi:MAG: glyoxalase [Lachnospiraceae bacterium]|nr:glyoxalase [Lachnospiraceae bacterium]